MSVSTSISMANNIRRAQVTSSTSRLIRLRCVGCKCKGLTCCGLRSMHHAPHRSLSDGRPCPLLALSGHRLVHRIFPPLGVMDFLRRDCVLWGETNTLDLFYEPSIIALLMCCHRAPL